MCARVRVCVNACVKRKNAKFSGDDFQTSPFFIFVHFHTVEFIFSFSQNHPPRGLSTLAREFTAATRIMQSSLNELNTQVSGKV